MEFWFVKTYIFELRIKIKSNYIKVVVILKYKDHNRKELLIDKFDLSET